MASFTKTIIRCAIDVLAPKSKRFVDDFTGQLPEAWNTTDIELQIAFFKGSGADAELVDTTVFEEVTASILATNRQGLPYCTKTVGSTGINTGLTPENWRNRTDQHVKISFTNVEFNLPLAGQLSALFWLVIFGKTTAVPPVQDTFGGTDLTVYEDGVPAPDGPVQAGNIVPLNAVYTGGTYVLNVTLNKVYKWTKGANDTDLVNGGQTVNVSDTNFTAQGASVTLRGTPGAAVTAVVRGGVYLTADESDARYLMKAADVRITSVDDGNTYRLDVRIIDGVAVESWTLIAGTGSTYSFVSADDGHTYRLDVRIVDATPTSSWARIA